VSLPFPSEEDLGLLLEEPASPPALLAVRARIFSGITALERFAAHAPRVASTLQVDLHEARRALHDLSDARGWMEIPPLPGVRIRPVVVGSGANRREALGAMFAEIHPGGRIPVHRHHGSEVMVVLQGGLLDLARPGEPLGAGGVLVSDDGTEHALLVPPEPAIPCLCLVRNDGWAEYL
jgi:anti-sigma factor ChrR (cupin superfamily)